MNILDCESVDSTYKSLESILNLPQEELKGFLINFNMDEYYDSHPKYYGSGDSLLFKMLIDKYEVTSKWDVTCWFHLTRTYEQNNFRDGILPLGTCLNSIWNYLDTLLDEDIKGEWINFRQQFEQGNLETEYSFLYLLKTENSLHWGPFAMLIKDVAFRAREIGNHDYISAPEIVEDICYSFEEIHGYNLLDAYKKATKPCIVKFKSEGSSLDYIGAVLFYLYDLLHDQNLSIYSNTCYDGHNNKVPSEDILKIEFLD